MRATSESLNEKQLKTIFSDYDLGEVCGFGPVTNGKENTAYYVSTSTQHKKLRETQAFPDTREFVLTLLAQNIQLNPALKPLLVSCAEAGLPVPRLFSNNTGTFQGTFNKQSVYVCSRMQGRHVFNPTIAQCASIGRFLARFHIANASQALESQSIRAEGLEQQANKLHIYIPPADTQLLRDSVEAICSMLSRTDVQKLPSGVIHGAMFRNNVLFNERGLSGALDFHQAGHGFWMFDLAVAVNDWCMDSDGESNSKKILALLGAYHRIRGLTREEFWYFPLFMLLGALSIWLNSLTATYCPQSKARLLLSKPKDFRQIVALQRSRPFHLDARLLEMT